MPDSLLPVGDNENSFDDPTKISAKKGNPQIDISCTDKNAGESDFLEFKNHLERQGLSAKTIKEYCYHHLRMSKILERFDLSQEVVDAFLDHYKDSPARAYLRQLLLFKRNKEIEIAKLRGRKKRVIPKIMTKDEKEKIASYLYNWQTRYGLMFELTDECGLRAGEIERIMFEDFDWDNWKLQKDQPCRLKIKGKGGKERQVVVSSNLMKGMVVYLSEVEQEENRTFFKIKYRRWNKVFSDACKECLGKTYKLHEIRHTRATEWYNEGKDITQIKNRLGHASISTTQLYINPDEEQEISKWEEEIR